jgi:hypothetical protein
MRNLIGGTVLEYVAQICFLPIGQLIEATFTS